MTTSRRACFEVLPRAHERFPHIPPCASSAALPPTHSKAPQPELGVQKCTPAGVQKCTPWRAEMHASWRAEMHTKKLDAPKKSCAENARQLACKNARQIKILFIGQALGADLACVFHTQIFRPPRFFLCEFEKSDLQKCTPAGVQKRTPSELAGGPRRGSADVNLGAQYPTFWWSAQGCPWEAESSPP